MRVTRVVIARARRVMSPGTRFECSEPLVEGASFAQANVVSVELVSCAHCVRGILSSLAT